MHQKALDLLYRSFDQQLLPAEQRFLDSVLVQSPWLQKEQARLTELRKMVAQTSAVSFSPRFADNVMRKIRREQEETRKESVFFEELLTAFRPIALAVVVVVIGLLSYNLTRSDDLSLSSALGEPEITLEQVLEPTVAYFME